MALADPPLPSRSSLHGEALGHRPSLPPALPGHALALQSTRGSSFLAASHLAPFLLGPYRARAGGTIELVASGEVAADAMIERAQEANRMMTWILRALGFLLILVGLKTLFRPLSVMADVVPAIGNLVEAGGRIEPAMGRRWR